jgi:SNF2 family DNA or RNA helicase
VTWPDWQIRPGAIDDISVKIKAISTHYKKSECLDLPPMLRKTVIVPLSKVQEKHYSMMKNNFITFLGDKACTAQLAITKALRLQQIVSGFIALEDESIVTLKENPRLDALEDLLEDLVVEAGKKVIVWACWKENYKQIRELLVKLGIKYVEVHGEISSKQKQEAIDAFCGQDDIKIFLGNQGAAGIGINLVQASYSIYYSRNFSLEHDIQSEARNYRGGSEIHESITRIDLVAQGTIDELILESLANKQEVSDKVLRDVSRL